MFSTLIYIGRFEPPHNGHFAIIRRALAQTEKLLVLIGSHEVCRSLRNPFTTEERIEMLKISLSEDEQKKITFIPIHDSNYNHKEWVKDVRACVGEALSGFPLEHGIAIIGHKKDDTSYYLDLFPEWEFLEIPLLEGGLSSTEIRKKWFSKTLTEQDKIPPSIYSYIKNKESEEWAKIQQEEYKQVEEYKQEWACTPYPPIFVAGDALVICNEHILLIKRGAFPGKGLFAMAGGFLDSCEPIKNCAIRELIEETGIELAYAELSKSIKDCQVFDDPDREPRGRMISHTFLFDLQLAELPKIKAADDASEALWFPLKDLDKIRSQLGGDHYKIIRKMLGSYTASSKASDAAHALR
ncbi:MAG: bifunctional nicotinamide-nucleotide adenylyltransferase/Nudix hydroxylase [Fibromonadaceae bacterium]|jgi:bifunctional NMN adenylyltransferase/nudix hydrolase|nr:bifunctional nicotinamide-nucleotide adenylyltransferase/Nudix hydroxylase [Fibromonadaceae bacterium]